MPIPGGKNVVEPLKRAGAVWWRYRGDRPLLHGRRDVIFRIADSRIVEAWEVYDDAGMWRQLQVAPPA